MYRNRYGAEAAMLRADRCAGDSQAPGSEYGPVGGGHGDRQRWTAEPRRYAPDDSRRQRRLFAELRVLRLATEVWCSFFHHYGDLAGLAGPFAVG
jgi:hypothetical protein